MDSIPALDISDLHAWYGDSHVLRGINLRVDPGEVVTLLGRNGAGRTTTLRAMLGLTGARKGSIRIRGTESIHLPAQQIDRLGIGYFPAEQGIFAGLTCEENLLLPTASTGTLGGGMSLAEIYDVFPNLQELRQFPGTRLSSGEQQMLAVARILRTGTNVLLLDEISDGLAPVAMHALARMVKILKKKDYTIIMVEQNLEFASGLADRFYLVDHGQITEQFKSSELTVHRKALSFLLGA